MVPFSFQILHHIIGVLNFPVEADNRWRVGRIETFNEVNTIKKI